MSNKWGLSKVREWKPSFDWAQDERFNGDAHALLRHIQYMEKV
jgi:hypothetical protein